ncbi:MAG: ribbon-helix-helix protein, CopG family [Thiobacillaceae bacterium]|nr:ribbon-helix-helix protein, CopG family [Thiobacillaceae bacterium]MDW8323966.1 ribbon-helix-helix protein, CopG family [Burkholderiales bacterium]
MPSGRRVNARLDPATQAELECLVRESGMTVTEVIRTAIHRLYQQRRAPAPSVADVFADLIGAIEGPADWSSDVKKALSEGLGRKHA